MKLITAFSSLILAIAALSAAPSKPVQIWVSSQPDLKYYRNMIEAYRQKVDKNFQAEIKAFGFMEMPDKLSIAIKSGVNTPDIVQFDEIFFSLYLKGQVPFLDLTDRLAKSPLRTGIVPQRMGLFTWKGRTYGIPQSMSNVVLWYREDLFQQNGIGPKDLGTWDKFEAAGRKVKSPTRGLVAMDWSYLGILLRQRGYDLFNAEGKVFPDSAIVAQTWKRVANWLKDSVAILPDRSNIFEPEFFNSYVANNGVMSMIGADWYGLDMIQNFDKVHAGKWRAMPLPVWTDSLSRGRRNTSSFSGQGLVIYKKSQQVEKSWKFVEWVMSDVDANVERFLQGNAFPPYRPAWADTRLSRKEPYFGNQNLAQLFVELSANAPFTVQSPVHAMVVNFIRESHFNAVLHNQYPVEEAMRLIQETLRKMSGGGGKKP